MNSLNIIRIAKTIASRRDNGGGNRRREILWTQVVLHFIKENKLMFLSSF